MDFFIADGIVCQVIARLNVVHNVCVCNVCVLMILSARNRFCVCGNAKIVCVYKCTCAYICIYELYSVHI